MDIGGSRLSLKKELREGTLDTSHAAFTGRLDVNTERLCRGGDDGDAGTKLLSCLLVRSLTHPPLGLAVISSIHCNGCRSHLPAVIARVSSFSQFLADLRYALRRPIQRMMRIINLIKQGFVVEESMGLGMHSWWQGEESTHYRGRGW